MDMKKNYQISLNFDECFFQDYAGNLVEDPSVAIVELVANSWDAGASRVDIVWPNKQGGHFEILDNGCGMSKADFSKYWGTFNYNRKRYQDSVVPITGSTHKRRVYGKNGKGRHSLFCFSDEYYVETWKNGLKTKFLVKKTFDKPQPYEMELIGEENYDSKIHGTKIYCNINRRYLSIDAVEDLVGSKFIVDPDFEVYLNGSRVNLLDFLKNATKRDEFHIPNEGTVFINIIESQKGRLSKLHGISWWVNKKAVGDHGWRDLENTYLDARHSPAKKYTIIIEADILENEILDDWTGFKSTPKANKIRQLIIERILQTIHDLLKDVRTEAKKNILQEKRDNLKNLGDFGRVQIGAIVEQIQKLCPSINQKYLSNIVEVIINLQLTNSGNKLIQQLSKISSNDVEQLTKILDEWTVTEAKIVLDLLGGRLKLINELERLTHIPTTDELHELQPLFEEGLWIFGPEYEGIKYLPNKTINTIIRELYQEKSLIKSSKRPDIVTALEDSVIEPFSCDNYEGAESWGISKIFILELKRGGIEITSDIRRQAEDYAELIRQSGKCDSRTEILCYVLGESVKCGEHNDNKTKIRVIALPYLTVLQKAKARTFNLITRIKESKKVKSDSDPVIEEILEQQTFDDTRARAP